MTNFIKRYLFLNLNIDDLKHITEDIIEENRKYVIIYSSVIVCGMAGLLLLSLWVGELVSSRVAYMIAIAEGIVLLLIAAGPAKKYKGLVVFCQYTLAISLLGFGILLGTVVEPNQASASFAVLLFAVPMLFTDMPYRINLIEILSIIIYIFAARATQNDTMFGFNMSVIMPYGIANLALTHFTSKMKLERFIYAHEKMIISEQDRLTGLYNRWRFEDDVESIKRSEKSEGYGVCSFDVNNLKEVNDQYGHKAGDELLIAAANAIKNTIGKFGKCYRIGGDEFEAIIEGVFPSPEELIKMLDKEASRYESSYGFKVSISSGIVEGDGNDIDRLLIEADQQMYQNKRDYYISSGMDRRRNRQ